LNSGGLAIVVAISVSEHMSSHSNLNRNPWINSKSMENWKKLQ
jgi:hypothetical protein